MNSIGAKTTMATLDPDDEERAAAIAAAELAAAVAAAETAAEAAAAEAATAEAAAQVADAPREILSPATRYQPTGIGQRLLADLTFTVDEGGLDAAYQAALHDVETTILARQTAVSREPTTDEIDEINETGEIMNQGPTYREAIPRRPVLRGAARRRMLEFARDEYMAQTAQMEAQQPPPPQSEVPIPTPVGQLNPAYLVYKHLQLTDQQIAGRMVRPHREQQLVEQQVEGRMVRRYSHEQLIHDHVQALEVAGREIAVRPPEPSPQVREPPRVPQLRVLAVGDPHFRGPPRPIQVVKRDDLIRDYMQGKIWPDVTPADIVHTDEAYDLRTPPPPGLNPIALARERRRLGLPPDGLVPRPSFGDAMTQLLQQQPRITMMTGTPMVNDRTELQQVMNLIRPPETVQPPIEQPRTAPRPMEPDADGWIDFTNVEELEQAREIIFWDHDIFTTQGMQEAIREIKDEVITGPTQLAAPITRGARTNPGNTYIDPETGDEHRLINGTWRNITQETAAIFAPIKTRPQPTRHPIAVEATPHTIEVQADAVTVHDYMQTAMSSPAALTHQMRLPIIIDDVPELTFPDGEETDGEAKQLTEITPTAPIVPTTVKGMTHIRTTPDIITNPTPNMFQRRHGPEAAYVAFTARHQPTWTDPPARTVLPRAGVPIPISPVEWVTPPVRPVTYQDGTPIPMPPVPQVPAPVPIPRVLPTMPNPRAAPEAMLPSPTRVIPTIPPIPAVRIPQKPTTRQPEVVLLPLPDRNPYLNLHRRILDEIARERDVHLTGSVAERMEQLFGFDKIMPDWIQSVLSKDINNFQMLTGPKLYVFGSMHGVSFTGVDRLQNRDLINYIRGFILVSNPQHPGRHCLAGLVAGLNRSVLDLLATRVDLNPAHLPFIDTADLRTALINGNLNHLRLDVIQITAARYQMLSEHTHHGLIAELYGVLTDDAWVRIAQNPPHPMEPIILNLDAYDKRKLALQFGMTIPLAFETSVDEYVRTNIVAYAGVLTRQQVEIMPLEVLRFLDAERLEIYLSQLTDTEIFTHVGIYVAYVSRQELVENTIMAIREPRFLYPAIRVPERISNRGHITIGLTEVTDTTIFMVGYGTAIKYEVYELADLIGSFYLDKEMASVEFRRPENDNLRFATRDVEGLRQLLDCFPSTPDIVTLKDRIDHGLITAREHIEHDTIARAELQKFTVEGQAQVREFLRKIFYIGMYMRRWQGPGHPFPLKKDDTRDRRKTEDDEQLRTDLRVNDEMKPVAALLEQMQAAMRRFCMQLKLCEYNPDGGINHGTTIFETEWTAVRKNEQCIRMASSKFIGTGYHYLRALFRETIPGINTKVIDHIT